MMRSSGQASSSSSSGAGVTTLIAAARRIGSMGGPIVVRAETGVGYEPEISKGFQERLKIRLLGIGQPQLARVRISGEHLRQGVDAAVVHVWRGEGHVAQCRDAELPVGHAIADQLRRSVAFPG